MKLLFVEDESLTRSSILEEIDWTKYGIHQIEEAADGMEAFSKLDEFMPDILLTDIRMPRMNGLEFANLLRRKNPKCLIIFMSGYAEKEYLKSAISLKAVSYVEKPIDLEELEEALQNAVNLYNREYRNLLVQKQWEKSSPIVIQDAALQLSRGKISDEMINRLDLIGLQVHESEACVTSVIKFSSIPPTEEEAAELLRSAWNVERVQYLYAFKDEQHLVLHLFSKDGFLRTGAIGFGAELLLSRLTDLLKARNYRFAASIGKMVADSSQIHESYTSAVYCLQETFYQGIYSTVVYQHGTAINEEEGFSIDPLRFSEMRKSIANEDFDHAQLQTRSLTAELKRKPNTLINHVKEIYYQFLKEIDKAAMERGASLQDENHPFQWDQVMNCNYITEVEELVLQKIGKLQQAITSRGSSSMTSRIMQYIHQHYMDEDLSVQEIADHFHITASYLISVFKEATGTTVRQFVIEYRIGVAKELLKNKQLKVSTVASLVGFRDGEYFAKIFRKATGMAPSEFRERFQP